jgi:hypothetical protein
MSFSIDEKDICKRGGGISAVIRNAIYYIGIFVVL